jgi:hypothetical protein
MCVWHNYMEECNWRSMKCSFKILQLFMEVGGQSSDVCICELC